MKAKNLYHLGAVTIKDFCFVESELRHNPKISVIVPVFNPEPSHFMSMVYSVINQHYQNWELILINASSDTAAAEMTRDCVNIDIRIKVIDTENKGISDNTNAGLAAASGEFVAFLDHDDLIHPCSLHSVAEVLRPTANQPDLIYTDEDKVDDQGNRYFDPFYKPSWSPDLLRNVNYINHLTVIRKEMVDGVKGLLPACDGAQDYDLLLRVIDKYQPKIRHIPRVLYHWRAAQSSTASDISTKQYIFKAGIKALKDHIKRNNIPASVSAIKGAPGFYELKYKSASFSVVIGQVSPSKYGASAAWIDGVAEELPEGSEIIVGDWYKEFINTRKQSPVKVIFIPEGRDYWLRAVRKVSNEVCICFKIAASPQTPGGLTKLAAVAAGHQNAFIMPTIIQGSTIFFSGIINVLGAPTNLFEGYVFGRNSFFGNTDWVRNVDNIGTNVVATKTSNLVKLLEESDNYERMPTVAGLSHGDNKPSYVVWAHTPFQYIGPLRFRKDNYYHRVQQFRLVPTSILIMYADNWGEKYERDES